MRKDEKGNIIGRGEDSALEIITRFFPDKVISCQVPLAKLLKDDWANDLSERQKKETIDIVVFGEPNMAIRIQDAHHRGKITTMRDVVQRKTLEWNGVVVIDLLDIECTELMKERVNDKSVSEVLKAFERNGIT
jgi:hypothetical protein